MTKYLVALALSVLALLLTAPARASVCTIPNTISNGALVDATPVQQNFNALVSCANNIDWQNIDSNGIYASQIIPINPGTATFGSGQDYTFENHLIVEDGVVVDSTAIPTTGIAGGNQNVGFRFWSNAGSGAEASFRFTTSTAVPSSEPVLLVGQPSNAYTYFEIDSTGDGVFAGGIAIDGTQPDGSSIIGGGTSPKGSPVPLWLISQATSSAKSNFAFLDNTNSIPAIVVENSTAHVIFTVDGIGDTQAAGGISSDNATPPANGYAGGGGTTPMFFNSNANSGGSQFVFVNNTNNAVVTVDHAGGISIGNSGQTDIEPTSASFGGAVNVPTVGPGNVVCTNNAGNLVACTQSQFGLPVYYEGGGGIGGTNPHITINDTPVCVSYSSNTLGTTSVTFSGKAQFPGNNYSITYSVASVSGTGPPVFVLESTSVASTGFTLTGYGNGGSGSGNICVNYIAIGD
jgi:hypothetical protein